MTTPGHDTYRDHPGRFKERAPDKTASDAPIWYTSDQASAWAVGYNEALEAPHV